MTEMSDNLFIHDNFFCALKYCDGMKLLIVEIESITGSVRWLGVSNMKLLCCEST